MRVADPLLADAVLLATPLGVSLEDAAPSVTGRGLCSRSAAQGMYCANAAVQNVNVCCWLGSTLDTTVIPSPLAV